jgi:hypothetical protein
MYQLSINQQADLLIPSTGWLCFHLTVLITAIHCSSSTNFRQELIYRHQTIYDLTIFMFLRILDFIGY